MTAAATIKLRFSFWSNFQFPKLIYNLDRIVRFEPRIYIAMRPVYITYHRQFNQCYKNHLSDPNLGLEGVELGRFVGPGSTLELLHLLAEVELLFVTSPSKWINITHPFLYPCVFGNKFPIKLPVPVRAPGSSEIERPVSPKGPESPKLIPSSLRRSSSSASLSS